MCKLDQLKWKMLGHTLVQEFTVVGIEVKAILVEIVENIEGGKQKIIPEGMTVNEWGFFLSF